MVSVFVSATLGPGASHGNDHPHLFFREVCLQTRQDTRPLLPPDTCCTSRPPLRARKVVADCLNHAEPLVRRHRHQREEYCTQQQHSSSATLAKPLLGVDLLRARAIMQALECSHPVLKTTGDRYNLDEHAKLGTRCPETTTVD